MSLFLTGDNLPLGKMVLSHGTRHNRGGGDALNYAQITQLFDSGDVSCSIGLGGSATRTTVYSLPTGWYNALPLAVYVEVGGTVATGETVSISVKAVLDNGDEYEIASYSVTGGTGSNYIEVSWSTVLSNIRGATGSVDGRRITSIVADVETSASSTSATATVRVIGLRS